MNSPTLKLEREARQAYDAVVSNQLTDEQFAALEARILADPEFRQAYVEQVDLETELEHRLGSESIAITSHRSSSHRSWGIPFAIALSLLLLLGAWNLIGIERFTSPMEDPLAARFTETQLLGQRPVAIVVQRSESSAADSLLDVGDRVKPGVLRLSRGEMQLEFLSGVRLQLEGPSEIHLLSDQEATLVHGHAAIVTPPETRSFSLNGPVSAIASGSSEFVYNVTDQQTGTIDVYQGEVMASLLGPSGDTLQNELVSSQQSATFAAGNLLVANKPFSPENRVDQLPVDDATLSTDARYANLVKEDGPLVYWRFEEDDLIGNQVRNHMSDRYAATLHGPQDGSLVVAAGKVQFGESPESRYLGISEPIEGLNRGEFTVEFWVRTDRMHWGTFFGILPVDQNDRQRESHLCVLEYANKTNVVHRPATVRMLYRYPPTSYTGGMNVFSAQSCAPGIWTHVVAVRRTDGIYLYCNGKLQFILDALDFDDQSAYSVLLGQLDSVRPQRQLEGQIDEVAIYLKALSEAQIRRHYEMIAGPPKT
ncbi:LamG domain-containing protein [Bremerella cremea]|uniref:LamG domain-containing protein n=1 Tax=Bremerella cremea TaxID=1031537 RepID=UPI0031F195B5